MRDIRLHVLRETDSLRRMHLVQAVIHACLDEPRRRGARDDAGPGRAHLASLARLPRARPLHACGAGAACVACRTWGRTAMVFVGALRALGHFCDGVRAPPLKKPGVKVYARYSIRLRRDREAPGTGTMLLASRSRRA